MTATDHRDTDPQAVLDRPLGEPQPLPAQDRKAEVSRLVLLDGRCCCACHSEWSISMSTPAVGIGQVEVHRPPIRQHDRMLLDRRRQASDHQCFLELELELGHRRPARPLRQVSETAPGRGAASTTATHVVVHLAELGIGAESLVAHVLDHREVTLLVEDATEVGTPCEQPM